jgi:perosamine synthetase
LIPYGKHTVDWRDAFAVAWQVRTKSLTQGNRIQEFEEKVANYVGAKYAVAVSSATAGLHISMLALELPSDSEVVTSPISFVASSNAILYANMKPVFLDIDTETINLSPELLQDYCQTHPAARAVIPVHFAGLPCDMSQIHRTANQFNLRIVEDAAHALGGSYETGEKIGSCKYSDMTVFSFHPVKSITTGEGGVITTNSISLYQRLLMLRSHGITKNEIGLENRILGATSGIRNSWYYEMRELGFNYRLTEIQAVLGISQMKKLNKFINKRCKMVKQYDMAFSGYKLCMPAQKQSDKKNSGNHIYPILIDFSKIALSREPFLEELRKLGIRAQIHYLPIPLHPYYMQNGFGISHIPNAHNYYAQCISIPLFPKLSKSKQKKVIRNIKRLINTNQIRHL